MLIDSHCHLHDREFFTDSQANDMIIRAHKAGVKKIVCIGTSHEDSLAARDFAENHDDVYWTYGIHPEAASNHLAESSFSEDKFKTLIQPNSSPSATRLVAVGEVGLDYHYDSFSRKKQIKLFEQMLQLALDNDLPVSFHIREAFDDFFAVIKNFSKIRGVVHSFTGSKKNLRRILDETDFYIGINGLATYSTLPTPQVTRILLETDAPFLTPKCFRGIINEPAYISEIARWLSDKLNLDFSIIERETTKNAKKLFKL